CCDLLGSRRLEPIEAQTQFPRVGLVELVTMHCHRPSGCACSSGTRTLRLTRSAMAQTTTNGSRTVPVALAVTYRIRNGAGEDRSTASWWRAYFGRMRGMSRTPPPTPMTHPPGHHPPWSVILGTWISS